MKGNRRTRRLAIGVLAVAGMAVGLLATAASTPRHAADGASTATAVLAAYKNPAPGSAPAGHSGGTLHNPVWGHQGNLRTLRPGPAARSQATNYDPDDPIDTGCWDANAYVAASALFKFGYVANWYSPDCGTNWAETVVTNWPEIVGPYYLHAGIKDMVTGEFYLYESPYNGTYTDMTHSANDLACAGGGLYVGYDYSTPEPGACA